LINRSFAEWRVGDANSPEFQSGKPQIPQTRRANRRAAGGPPSTDEALRQVLTALPMLSADHLATIAGVVDALRAVYLPGSLKCHQVDFSVNHIDNTGANRKMAERSS
jgi:hypothetical protein